MTRTIRILIADEYPIFCQGIKDILTPSQEIYLLACVTCHTQLLSTCHECQPDIMLLSGTIAISWYLEMRQNGDSSLPKIIGLLANQDDASLHRFLQHGAVGLFLKSDPPQKLVEAILTVNQGERWISARLLSGIMGNPRDKPGRDLNEQDLAVLRLIAADKTNAEVAQALHISQRTVGKYLSHINTSLNSKTRVGAVAQALRHKLIE